MRTAMHDVVVGFDLGHSAVKLTYDGPKGIRRALVPSAACGASSISNEEEAHAARAETVVVGGESYFVGNTALLQGRGKIQSGLSGDWLSTPEHAALLRHGKHLVDRDGAEGRRLYVLGLPVRQFTERDKERLRSMAKDLLEIKADGDLAIIPQPMGGYYASMFDRHGFPQKGRDIKGENWAVIDVGYYTSDFILLMGGRWIEQACDGASGVSAAAKELQRLANTELGIEVLLSSAEEALREGVLRKRGKREDVRHLVTQAAATVATNVADVAQQLLQHYIDDLDGVLVTGGGAELVLPTLADRWEHAQLLTDNHTEAGLRGPRFSVSEGYYRFGRNKVLLARMT